MLAPNTESTSPSAASGRTRRIGYLTRALAAIIAVAGAASWSWCYASLPDPFKLPESLRQRLTTPSNTTLSIAP